MRHALFLLLAVGLAGCGEKAGTPGAFGPPASRGDEEIDLRGSYRCWGGTRPTVSYQLTMRSDVKPREGGDYWFVFEHHGVRKEHKLGPILPGREVTAGNSYEDWMESNKDPNPARFWIEFRPVGGRTVRVSQLVSARDENRPPGK